MLTARTVRDFSKLGDAIPVSNLTDVQGAAYKRFLQQDKSYDKRNNKLGLESLLI